MQYMHIDFAKPLKAVDSSHFCEEDVDVQESIEHPQLTRRHIIVDAHCRRRLALDLYSMYRLL